MTEEQKEKYANFLDKVSEILCLNKPIDVLRLCAVTDEYFKPIEKRIAELEKENIELKVKVGLSIDCEKAQRNGELCLGYGGDEDEPCEQCKNCIKCECGYYQLGETEKDEQLTKARDIIKELYNIIPASMSDYAKEPMEHARKFMTEETDK